MGVRRAVEMVLDLQRISPPTPIVTYGPLIHNPQTLELLKSRGILEAGSLDEIESGTVVIRAHGISPQERQQLKDKGVGIIDATCPRVARVQAVIRKHAGQGHFCIIVGDEDHPEVRGLMGFASAGGMAVPSGDAIESLDSLPVDQEICVVAQTTQEEQAFEKVVEILKGRHHAVHVYNTICDSTRKRQAEVSRMAQQVDFIVVVGGKGSGNTNRLVKVARAQGVPALHVETDEDVQPTALAGAKTVGVTAGASTPNWQIRRVIGKLREIGMSRAAGPLKTLRTVGDIAVMTYCWAAMAGAGLTVTCLILQGRQVTWLPPVVSMLFVLSMHLFNRIQERAGAVRFNTPEIASFYARHRGLLTGVGVLSSIAAVILSFRMGDYAFAILVAMLVTGMMYTMPVLSRTVFPRMKWRSLKDLPGSKTPLVAAGWAVSAAVLPVIGSEKEIYWPGLAVAFAVAFGMVFWRTALSDLLDVQGDRIVGRETIPILIGVKDTRKLLVALLLSLALLLALSAAAGWIPMVGYWLIANTMVFGILFMVYRGGHMVDRLSFEAMTDGNFLLAGVLSMFYGMS
jgi:(E)-4-hydroxy-3-methyl-but-2-enyl pyrophosphate reductase